VVAGAEGSESMMMGVIAGTSPKTDASGRFVLDKISAGKGVVLVMDDSGFKPLATKPYTASAGQRVDLGAIEIVPPRKGDAGTFGMTTEPTTAGDGLTVVQVKPGGPAAGAGLVAGDTITAIAGRTVKDLGAPASAQYLSSGSIGIGTTVNLGLARGATVAVTSVKW
jgi:membrane-associated protease RseP (regulator of RpoE activity)